MTNFEHFSRTEMEKAAKFVEGALVLADGTTFEGELFGATGVATGELIFNTALTGYQ